MSLLDFPAPYLIGAPARYTKWRNLQADAVLAAHDSKKRFVIPNAPTGFGKSLVVVSHALLSGARVVILTATKALQGQYVTDFKESGLIEIKGINAYECIEGGPTGRFGDFRREGYRADRGLPVACDEAPCQAGAYCPRRDSGCLYYDAYRLACASSSRLIVTNYAYWMSITKYGEGIGPVDILVLDEAHNAIDELGGFVGTELRYGEMEALIPGARQPDSGADQHDWVAWAGFWRTEVANAIEAIKQAIRDAEFDGQHKTGERMNYGTLRRARDLRRLNHKLATIAHMAGDWIIEHTQDNQRRQIVKFDPVWPGEYAESVLFRNIPKIVMVSATVRPETAYKLGVKPEDIDFKEYPSPIPKENRPVIYCPAAQMNRNVTAGGKMEWSRRIDQIIARRLDRKGIVHTVSYPRAHEVYVGSEYKDIMLLHDSTDTKEKIELFKRSKPPLVLISPVLDTGYDFPYTTAEYQIISKMPFPVTVDKVVKARTERDKGYRDYVTATTLTQMAGRICRAEDDMGETIIVDADFEWWFKRGRFLCPKWFVESVRYEQTLGMPLPKLNG